MRSFVNLEQNKNTPFHRSPMVTRSNLFRVLIKNETLGRMVVVSV